MPDLNGEAGSPSLAQPTPKPKRPWKRTTMKSILREQEAVKRFAGATEKQIEAQRPKRPYVKKHPRWKHPSNEAPISRAINLSPKTVPVTLQLRHSVNGKFYGPGPVRVSPAKAQLFLNIEHEAAQKELSLMQQQAFVIGVGPGGPVKRQVPWAQFDNIIMRE